MKRKMFLYFLMKWPPKSRVGQKNTFAENTLSPMVFVKFDHFQVFPYKKNVQKTSNPGVGIDEKIPLLVDFEGFSRSNPRLS
jgi:hypothetical protein